MKEFTLNWNQKRILKRVGFLKKQGFYLAGGTALALQLGHRTSKDFDFYTPKHFSTFILIKNFTKVFGKEVIEASQAPDTTYLTIKKGSRKTDLSFFRYPYKLIQPLVPYLTVDLASMQDIAAMKIQALIGRGKKRDFVDIYFLIEKYGLQKVLYFTKEKYPEAFNAHNCLDALLYFKDADKPQQNGRRLCLYENISWQEIKEGIEERVKQYQLAIIKEAARKRRK